MSSTWGDSWLASWGVSWDGAVVPPIPTPDQTSGGAVIVDLPKRKKKKQKDDEELTKAKKGEPREFTEEEAAGMAAVYGSQMVSKPVDPPSEQPQNIVQSEQVEEVETFEPILESFDIPAYKTEKQEKKEIEPDEEDDIALLLAIIEAIG